MRVVTTAMTREGQHTSPLPSAVVAESLRPLPVCVTAVHLPPVCNLVTGVDEEATRAKIDAYKRENALKIKQQLTKKVGVRSVTHKLPPRLVLCRQCCDGNGQE